MARHKAFDQERVLSQAMETFWRYGYEGTSIQDLVENMGINRGSIYDTFQDKRTLFLAAIAHYNQTVVKEIVAPLEDHNASKKTIFELFEYLVVLITTDSCLKGCFLTNTTVERCPHDAEIATQMAIHLKRIEKAFFHALDKSQQLGEIEESKDIKTLAVYLTTILQGLQVMGKVYRDPQQLREICQVALSILN